MFIKLLKETKETFPAAPEKIIKVVLPIKKMIYAKFSSKNS
jgi:hypothetical protein